MNEPGIAHLLRVFARPTETFIVDQIKALRGFRPEVFCHHRDLAAPPAGVEIFSLDEELKGVAGSCQRTAYSLFRFLTPCASGRLLERLRARKIALLHLHYLVDARFYLPVIRRAGLPSVVSCYGWDVSRFPRAAGGLGRLYLRRVFPVVDAVLAMSDEMKRALISLGCPEEKVSVYYYGVPVKKFYYPDRKYDRAGAVEILFCGRLVPKKAPGILLEALEIMEREGTVSVPWKLTYVGSGSLREEVERKAERMGWKGRVGFTGHIATSDPRLVEAYRRADVFCLPSRTAAGDKEGIPGTLVEAMASGLPVISTRHAGIPEVVSDGVEGTLVAEGDAPALARALARALSDSAWREEKGRAAARRARGLDLNSRIGELEKIYRELIDRGRTI